MDKRWFDVWSTIIEIPHSLSRASSSWLKDRHKNRIERRRIFEYCFHWERSWKGRGGAFDEVSIRHHPTFFRSLLSRPWISHSGTSRSLRNYVHSNSRGRFILRPSIPWIPWRSRIYRINRFLNSFFSPPPSCQLSSQFFRDLVSSKIK